jgi:PAS domain S-box-containing protein
MIEASYRILVVDDDQAQAQMVIEFLHISGYQEIDHAADIRSFWHLLDEHEYDVILLDYRLPDGTGLDVLGQMLKRDIQIPVIMVTGQGNERIAAQAILQGASEYILKSGDYLITIPALIQKSIRARQLKQSVQSSLNKIRYQALLLDNVRDAIVVWDLAGRITFWNPAALSLFGFSPEERIGRPVAQYYLSMFTPPIEIPKEGEIPSSHVIRSYTNRMGKTITVSSRLTALHDEGSQKRLIGYMDVSHDISRNIESEQALRESEARYRAIVEDYQTELICRFKPNGTLTFVNEVFCHYFGKAREQLLGMNLLYYIPESERPKLIEHLVSFGPEKSSATLEHQVELPGRGLRWMQRTDRAIFDARGRIIEFQSMARDITERKKMELQVQAAQSQLIQTARMATIGEVASGVAHQIYNPLTTIIADAQILLRSLSQEHPGRDSAEAIEQAGWRLQQVVQRLMEFSRPPSETREQISLTQTIQSAVSLVYASMEAAGCRLQVEIEEQLPAITGNKRQIEALWVNLLLLARDATEEGRSHTIHITARRGPSNSAVVLICDDGKPIPPDQIAAIFEPNFVSPQGGRGSGIEFSICREIVRQHGGEITAESTPGRETTFRVILPGEV